MTDMVSCLLALIDAYCPELTELHPEDNERYPWSDLGNGNLYADFFKSIARAGAYGTFLMGGCGVLTRAGCWRWSCVNSSRQN